MYLINLIILFIFYNQRRTLFFFFSISIAFFGHFNIFVAKMQLQSPSPASCNGALPVLVPRRPSPLLGLSLSCFYGSFFFFVCGPFQFGLGRELQLGWGEDRTDSKGLWTESWRRQILSLHSSHSIFDSRIRSPTFGVPLPLFLFYFLLVKWKMGFPQRIFVTNSINDF